MREKPSRPLPSPRRLLLPLCRIKNKEPVILQTEGGRRLKELPKALRLLYAANGVYVFEVPWR